MSTDRLTNDFEDALIAVSCACGRTILSATHRGLLAQVIAHWRLQHGEPIAITPQEFIARHAFVAYEGS